jgi:hypothetical protein
MRRLRCLILSWAARAQTERFWTVSSKPSLLQVTPPAIARRATFSAAGAGTATAGPWSRSSAGLSPSVLFVALHAPAIILAHGVQHRLPGVRPAPQHRPSILADKENSHAKLKRTQATVGYGTTPPRAAAAGMRAEEHRKQVFDERRQRFQSIAEQRSVASQAVEPANQSPVVLR